MKTQFFAQEEGWNARRVALEATWAAEIIKVAGGWLAFESYEDLRMWRKQK